MSVVKILQINDKSELCGRYNMYFHVVFWEQCGASPQAEIVAQLAARVTRLSFVESVLVLICFFSQTENPTRRSSDTYFHSVLLPQRQEKKKLLILPASSAKGQASPSALDRLFRFVSHCVRAAQSWSVRSCFLHVRAATFTLPVFSCTAELGIKDYNALSRDPEQSESLLQPHNVCVEECVAVVVGDDERLCLGRQWQQACSGGPCSWLHPAERWAAQHIAAGYKPANDACFIILVWVLTSGRKRSVYSGFRKRESWPQTVGWLDSILHTGWLSLQIRTLVADVTVWASSHEGAVVMDAGSRLGFESRRRRARCTSPSSRCTCQWGSEITALCCCHQVKQQISWRQRAASPVAQPAHAVQNRRDIVSQGGPRVKAIPGFPPAAGERVSASLQPNTWLAAETAGRLPAAVQRTTETWSINTLLISFQWILSTQQYLQPACQYWTGCLWWWRTAETPVACFVFDIRVVLYGPELFHKMAPFLVHFFVWFLLLLLCLSLLFHPMHSYVLMKNM